jgi:hypothetical protein
MVDGGVSKTYLYLYLYLVCIIYCTNYQAITNVNAATVRALHQQSIILWEMGVKKLE